MRSSILAAGRPRTTNAPSFRRGEVSDCEAGTVSRMISFKRKNCPGD